jgi:hypothetical protein
VSRSTDLPLTTHDGVGTALLKNRQVRGSRVYPVNCAAELIQRRRSENHDLQHAYVILHQVRLLEQSADWEERAAGCVDLASRRAIAGHDTIDNVVLWKLGIEPGRKPGTVRSKNDLSGTMMVLDGVGRSIKVYQKLETRSNGPTDMALVSVAAIVRVADQQSISLLGSQ